MIPAAYEVSTWKTKKPVSMTSLLSFLSLAAKVVVELEMTPEARAVSGTLCSLDPIPWTPTYDM